MQIVPLYISGASEEEITLARTERQGEINNLMKEKLTLSQKNIEAENAQARLKVSSFSLFAAYTMSSSAIASHDLNFSCEG